MGRGEKKITGTTSECVLYPSFSGAGGLITKLHLVPRTPYVRCICVYQALIMKLSPVLILATQSQYNLAGKLTENSVLIYLQSCNAAAVIPVGVYNVIVKGNSLKFLL